MNASSNGATPREPIEAEIVDDEEAPPAPAIKRPSKRELDAAFAKAREYFEPVVEIGYLTAALDGAVTTAMDRAKRKAAQRAREAREREKKK